MPLTFEPIDSQRLTLRPLRKEDLTDLMAVNGDAEVTRFLPYATWQNSKDAEAWFLRMSELAASGTALLLVLVRKSDDRVIGTVLLFKFDEKSQRLEIG